MSYLLHIAVYVGIYAIAALSLNLIVGYCGRLSMAHAAYFALGSYAYAILSILQWPFLLAMIAATAFGGVASLALSIPAQRFRGDFFVLLSLAVNVLVLSALTNWFDPSVPPGTFRNLTNGPFGLSDVPHPIMLGLPFGSPAGMAAISVSVALLSAILCVRITKSSWGRLLKAVRDDELAARTLGKNVRRVRSQAVAIACGLASASGVLYAAYVGYIDPSVATLGQSVLMLSMVIIGGAGNTVGPVLGAALLISIPELLRFVDVPATAAANVRNMLFGALLVMLMRSRTQGLAGSYRIE